MKRIDLDQADLGFAHEVAAEPGGEGVFNCFSCSTCSAGCPVQKVSDKYNPRRIIRMIITGQRQAVLTSDFLWHCSSCYTCDERCPQGVSIPSLITALRNIAAREGYLPSGYEKQKELLLTYGRLYEVDDFDNKKRSKVDLPSIVTSNRIITGLAASLKTERDRKDQV